jgi:hypothetical protein
MKMTKEQLHTIVDLADYGIAESPWAWSPDFKWTFEQVVEATKAAGQLLATMSDDSFLEGDFQ